jgi:hypothetical protein
MQMMRPFSYGKPQYLGFLLRTGVTTIVGIMIGVAFGIAVQNLLVGLVLGTGIGIGTGVAIHQRHREEEVDIDQVLWAAMPLLVFALITAFFWR